MLNPRQFSAAYLFLEVFWVAATIGLGTLACGAYLHRRSPYDFSHSSENELGLGLLVMATAICCGAAIGGVFHRMWLGILVAVTLVVAIVSIAMQLTPTVS